MMQNYVSIIASEGFWNRLAPSAVFIYAVFIWGIPLGWTTTNASREIAIKPIGVEQTVFSHGRDACRPEDIPDSAARAFRDSKGQVHLLATHFINFAFIGSDLSSVRRDCVQVYGGAQSDDPSRFDDRAWLASFWTENGETIYALVHNEFQGNLRPALCPSRVYFNCWYNSITAAISTDRGYHFARQDGGIVAAPAYRYDPAAGQPVGYFEPSNIVSLNGYYYAMIAAAAIKGQKKGDCLIRNENLSDVDAWRAWDGSGFTVRLGDPYLENTRGDPPVCVPVDNDKLRSPVLSLVRHGPSGLYLAMISIEAGPSPGFYMSSSADLLNWTEPKFVLDNWPVINGRCSHSEMRAYPSLLDPNTRSRNFDTVTDKAYLYYTRFHLANCAGGLDRDLVRIPVEIVLKF